MMKINRRDFIKALGLGSTTAAAACSADPLSWDPLVPMEHVYPYIVQPEQVIPGTPTYFTSLCMQCSTGCGIIAKSREGRIINIEGNKEHPINKGQLCFQGQTGLQETYSPDRIAKAMQGTSEMSWDDALKAVGNATAGKVAWIGRPRTGASNALVEQFMKAANGSVLYWEEQGKEALKYATKSVFGIEGVPTYHLEDAHIIVSFGSDFLQSSGDVVSMRGWADSRDNAHGGFISKMYTVGPRIGLTAANTDVHISAKPGSEAGLALAIAKKLAEANGYQGPAKSILNGVDADALIKAADIKANLVTELVKNLSSQKGKSVILAGDLDTSASAGELALATLVLNEVAGNIGHSVVFGMENRPNLASAKDVLDALNSGLNTVFIDDLDLVYSFSPDAKVSEALGKIKNVVLFSAEKNDSVSPNTLVIPTGTSLEKWGDSNSTTGLYSISQATMHPVNGNEIMSAEDIIISISKAKGFVALTTPTATEEEVVEDILDEQKSDQIVEAPPVAGVLPPGFEAKNFYAYLQTWWEAVVYPQYKENGGSADFKQFWIDSLQQGFYAVKTDATKASFQLSKLPAGKAVEFSGTGEYSLVLFPHPYIGAGRQANRPWAREIPDPLSGFSWDTWVEIHPETADKLGLKKNHGVTLKTSKGSENVGWFGSPGVRKDTVAVVMGGGKENSGRYAKYGISPTKLISHKLDANSGAISYVVEKASLSASSERNAPNPQNGLIKSDTLSKNNRNINFTTSVKHVGTGTGTGSIVPIHELPATSMAMRTKLQIKNVYREGETLSDMYPEPEHPTYRFALAIDLNRCTGCNACNAACYAENNIPVVGPEQIRLSRSMGWIRLSRYWEGSDVQESGVPDIRFQPVMCQHCAHAPCEGVCPVLATYHNLDGLNAMIYNRCVGTRYCANNCPYSARRFNFHTFTWPESFNLMLNPDVLIREMGVMEKCTFCIQNIRSFKDDWRDQVGFAGQGVAPKESDSKEIATAYQRIAACAAVCPTNAITFGNLKDESSVIHKKFNDERTYTLLGELNDKPGVRYLARVVHTDVQLHHGAGHGDESHGDHAHDEDKGHDAEHKKNNHNEKEHH